MEERSQLGSMSGRRLLWLFEWVSVVLSVVVFGGGCIFSDGDSDGNGDNGEPDSPSIVTVSMFDGQIVTARDITVSWEGNEDAVYYRYVLDGEMSEVMADSTVTVTDMEEGSHVFILEAFNDSLSVSSEPDTVRFSVDAVTGPGIVFSPRRITTGPRVDVYLEDVEGLMAAHIELSCENRCVLFGDFSVAGRVDGADEVIVVIDDSSSQRLVIDVAFAGATEGISGSMIFLGSLTVTALREGRIVIDEVETEFRDIHNGSIALGDVDFVRVVQ